MRRGRGTIAALLFASLFGVPDVVVLAEEPPPSVSSRIDQAETTLRQLNDRLTFIEREYIRHDESAASRAARQFSHGEIQFLLKDWYYASVLLYDAIDIPEFRASLDYPTALYYLAESLYQQGDLIPARNTFRQLLALHDDRTRRSALLRTLQISVKLGSYDGIDDLVEESRRAFGAELPPEIPYLSAKAIWGRRDLPAAEHRRRSLEAFSKVTAPYQSSARYFMGALQVEVAAYDAAAAEFNQCIAIPALDKRQQEVRDLCQLALGRIAFEEQRYAEAANYYQEVPRDSKYFNDALFESSWTFVRQKAYEQALRTAELIVELAPDSPLAPEASILVGHLYLKLGKYTEALTSYNDVINRYTPVRDELDALLSVHQDPVRYFNELTGRADGSFDVATVLPPVAVKWANTHREAAIATRMVGELESGRKGVGDGRTIAERIEVALDRGSAFPRTAEGLARCEAAQNGAVEVLGNIVALEGVVLGPSLVGVDQVKLRELELQRAEIEPRFRSLAKTPEQMILRREEDRRRLLELDRQTFQMGYQIDACNAMLMGSQKWLEDHRSKLDEQRRGRSEVIGLISSYRESLTGLELERQALRREVVEENDAAGVSSPADAATRESYRGLLERELALLEVARKTTGPNEDLARLNSARERATQVRLRADAVESRLRADVKLVSEDVRRKLEAERNSLGQYGGQVTEDQNQAKDLIGNIALSSFEQVRNQFRRLLLKADVGLVDVAWTRKRQRLEEIQQLSGQKAKDLGSLDEEYGAILKEDE